MTEPQRQKSFWSELKRRHVYRVAAVYLAVAFGVWQVADILVPALGLPAWVMKLVVIGPLLTFPFVLVLAWAYDITPDGIRATRDDASPAAHGTGSDDVAIQDRAPRGARLQRTRLALAALAGVVFASAGWWAIDHRRDGPEMELSEVSLAVFPFTVRGNDALNYLREGVVDLLSRNLTGATTLQPLDPSLMLKVTGGTEPQDAQAAGGIARRVGAARFVVGSVSGSGGRIRIDATLYAVHDSVRHVATKSVEGDTTQVFELIDQLTAGLLSELMTGAVSERIVRTAALTTSSLTALKAYLEGEQSYRRGEHEDAADAFQRALVADSAFPLARYRLAMSYHMRGEHDAAHREIARVQQQHLDRLTPHDRRVIDAFHAFHAGSLAAAEDQLRTIVQEFPRDLEARVILAELLMWQAPWRAEPLTEARRLLEHVLEADPKFMCIYCQLSGILEDEGDIDGAERLMRLRQGRDGGDTTKLDAGNRFWYGVVRNDSAQTLAALAESDTIADPVRYRNMFVNNGGQHSIRYGRFDVTEAMLARSADRADAHAMRVRLAAKLNMARGRWRDASADLTTLSGISGGQPLDVLATQYVILAPFEMQPSGLDDLRSRLVAWQDARVTASPLNEEWPRRVQPAVRLYLLGLTSSRMGDAAATRAYADSLARLVSVQPQDANLIDGLARVVRADRALREGQPRVALQTLEGISRDIPPSQRSPYVTPLWHEGTIRAYAHRALDEHEEARRWLRHHIGAYGAPDAASYGTYHRDMGFTLDALGRHEDAAEHFASFVTAWENADPELQPQVQAARERLQRNRR